MTGPSSKSRLKYLHYYTLEKEDWLEVFKNSLRYTTVFDALIEYFKKNKESFRYIKEEVSKG